MGRVSGWKPCSRVNVRNTRLEILQAKPPISNFLLDRILSLRILKKEKLKIGS